MERNHIPIPRTKTEPKVKSRLQRGGRIKPVSATMARLNRVYRSISERFLGEHPYCQHWIAECGLDEKEVIKNQGWYVVLPGHPLQPHFTNYRGMAQVPRSAEIHHKRGRGKYYLDISTFMACRPGHSNYIHGKTEEAYRKGYMLPR
jgi:hypothetical protein